MSELNLETRAMLHAARTVHDPAEGARARVRRSLHAKLGVGALAATTAATTTALTTTTAAAGSAAVFGMGTKTLFALALTAAAGVWTAEYVETKGGATATATARPTPTPTPTTAATTPTPTTAAPVPRPTPTTATPSIGAEVALLADARAALSDGRPERALVALGEHARRFPTGALREEREVERIDAYCALGAIDDASRVARSFLRVFPSSPLAGRVRASCARIE